MTTGVRAPVTAPPAPNASGRPRHPVRAELLRGFAPWSGLAALLSVGGLMVSKAAQWQGSWPETMSNLHLTAAVLAVPLALAAGAWQGGRERRTRMGELRASMPRGPLAQFLVCALPVALWVTAGYALAAAGSLLASLPYTSAGHPLPLVLLGDALTVGACALLGHVAGRTVPWRLAAPVLALGGYVLVGLALTADSAVRFVGPAGGFPLGSSRVPVWWQPLVFALWGSGLALTAVLAHAARRRATALVPLAAALAAAGVLVQSGDSMWQRDPLIQRQVCDDSAPRVCVSAAYPGMLPEVSDALSGLMGRLDGVQNLPVRFEDLPGRPHGDEAELPDLTPLGWGVVRGELTDPRQYAWEAARKLVRDDCPTLKAQDARIGRTDEAVLRWLAPNPLWEQIHSAEARGDKQRRAAYRADEAALDHLEAMSPETRRAWLSRYFATARDCAPDPKEVPSL
ncbi:hypothetical protein [Streptomyces sp. AcE210]|uniref:hypothetical protein n=1 Tax=Streptomyces sp. AcE210 TaxID=2292703 RepID=UPI000E308F68|nr:hypothetical protein [Streptomyces sp. AcE210]RFC74272.1 hypothetical protein DXZ75_47485 [Streptomyces sp. AcE210]